MNFLSLSSFIINFQAGASDAVRAEWLVQWTSNADGKIEKKEESESRYGDLKNVSISAQVDFKRLSIIQEGQVGLGQVQEKYYFHTITSFKDLR